MRGRAGAKALEKKNRGFASRGLPVKREGTTYFLALALLVAATAAFLRFM
jgi:hypothetical protein